MLNFDFDDTQYALRDMARELFTKESPTSRIRELWQGNSFDRGVWKTMADAGIVGITVPEEYGGAGGGELDLTLVYEEAGRACLPEPILETTGIAAPLIAAAGSDTFRARWLPAIANGDALVAVRPSDSPFVAWADESDLLLYDVHEFPHAVAREHFSVTRVSSVDASRPIYTVNIDQSKAEALGETEPLERPTAATRWVLGDCRGSTGAASMLLGVSARMLERTTAYVQDRHQFGRPVGSFQAIKHKLAMMHQAIENARPATWFASYALAHASLPGGIPALGAPVNEAKIAASVAKIAATTAEALCNQESLQCHGGIGFTWEDDLHLWLKRGMALRGAWGTLRQHRRFVANEVWDPFLYEGEEPYDYHAVVPNLARPPDR
jgi:alkylation response protein AidB-like acyl-CoA dehydrogenase